MPRFTLILTAFFTWTLAGLAQDADLQKLILEALNASAALRSGGKLDGVPPDSEGKFMLQDVPVGVKLTYPVSITLKIETPGHVSRLSFILVKDGPDAKWRLSDKPAVKYPDLREELLRMKEQDQGIRMDPAARQPDNAYLARWAAIDEANTARLKAIVAQSGWPGQEQVGQDGALAAFLIVQHADRDRTFQKEMLAKVQAAYQAGQIPAQQYAYLLDRVRVGENKPQVYGSQSQMSPDGTKWVPYPIEDEAHVDERRRTAGLGPLAEYFVELNQHNPIRPK